MTSISYCAAWFIWAVMASTWANSLKAEPLPATNSGWLAFGDLRGHLEPCGCDPRTDLGGIRRVAALIQRERDLHPSIGIFDLGNDISDGSAIDPVKTSSFVDTMAWEESTAILLNTAEILHLDSLRRALRSIKTSSPTTNPSKVNFVLSNATRRGLISGIANPIIHKGDYHVWGYVHHELIARQVRVVNEALIKQFKKETTGIKTGTKVLLFSGSDDQLRLFADARIFDVIIRSSQIPFGQDPGLKERSEEDSLISQMSGGEVATVPWGGQGVLRGGDLRFQEAKSIEEIFSRSTPSATGDSTSSPQPTSTPPGVAQGRLFTWLENTFSIGAPLEDVMSRYNAAVAKTFTLAARKRQQDLDRSPFVGAQACQGCHQAEFAKWQSSKHASAYSTLQLKGKDHDPECVSCHVLGAKEKGGFVSIEASPQFAGVQCETCHGPRRQHVANTAKHPVNEAPARAVCESCHHGGHSPAFDYAKFWPQIAHGKSK